MFERIEKLRSKLHSAWGKSSSDEILALSQELDVEIVEYMKHTLASQRQQLKVQLRFGSDYD
ncbi:hypothetical protein Desaci_0677 [Desulfosporosinus acidiphilus SJ4]|uniref:Spo0E like sporulation regulatory protein n=1 Tax=Desulfosporosinus acidiphilus (strain DSM 22704 / JCM 16185 / SJ4) TaxID=646529 RepID=I4D1R4_DESAJ|nr:aspartyl-phosphate phosphatase Spo0E family protein [Desulfosporosinus acidiphilus]AFM39738.1 hypothetical protein Desaci_0677 [Desulfosporosinus acidiphilus SJ4]